MILTSSGKTLSLFFLSASFCRLNPILEMLDAARIATTAMIQLYQRHWMGTAAMADAFRSVCSR